MANALYITIILIASLLFSGETALAEGERVEENTFLKGRVLSSEGRPVGGARIIILDEDTQQEVSGRSDRRGNFEIKHPKCSTLSFDVLPSGKSGLTHAHYSHVSGELSKHFIVKLHKGFLVSGRVLAEGKGVKGLKIRVIGQNDDGGKHHAANATVHGGGKALSKADGEFSLLLTPGKKILQIKNDVYSNLSPVYQHEFTVTGDTQLPDMTLPLIN